MKKTLSALLAGAVSCLLLASSTAHADPMREAYMGQCRPAARAQLRGKAGPRVVDRLCGCAADRAEASGWVLPEFPARDAEECVAWAQGLLADSPFARLQLAASSPRPEPVARLSRRGVLPRNR